MKGVTLVDNLISLIIIVIFLLGIIIVGAIAGKNSKDSDGYLVGNRKSSYLLIVGTLFATFWGGGTVLGGSGAAFNDGIMGVIEDPFAAGLALILVGVFFVRTLRRLKLTSVGELYQRRFNKSVSYSASALMIPTYIIWTAVQLLAIGKIANVLLGINFMLAFLVGTAVVLLYTILGGILAVVWTDAIQMIIIIVGLVIIMVVGVNAVGGVSVISANTPSNYWDFFPNDTNGVSWLAYIAMWIGMALGNIPSPDIAQRAFVAKDEKTAQSGMITAGFLYWTIGLIPVFIALIGITMINKGLLAPDVMTMIQDDSELLIPLLAKELLGPIGLGIFAGSLIAAVLSSASTSLFATAVLISNDIYQPLFMKTKDDHKLVVITRVSVLIVGGFSILIGLLSTNLYDLTIFAFTLLFGILFFPFVLALKSKRVNSYGVLAGMFTGLLVNLIGAIVQRTIIPEPWEFFTIVPALLNLIVIIIVTYFTRNINRATPLDQIYIE
jgi:SSS family transporter